MKLSNRFSVPSSALFVASCLLVVPKAVQSEKIFLDDVVALSPGIDRLMDATKSQYKRHFGRSLEEALDSIFTDLLDDDITLNYLAEIDIDENLVQCLEETDALYAEFPSMEEEVVAFATAISMSTTMTSDSLVVTMEYSEESKESLRQLCATAGGYLEAMTGSIECSFFDSEMGMTIETSISGYASCLANTNSCKSSDDFLGIDFLMLGLEAGGLACEVTGDGDAQEPPPPPPPPSNPVVEEEPEPETLPVPSVVEEEPESEPEEPEELPATTIVEDDPEPESTDSDQESSAALESAAGKCASSYSAFVGLFIAVISIMQMQ